MNQVAAHEGTKRVSLTKDIDESRITMFEIMKVVFWSSFWTCLTVSNLLGVLYIIAEYFI